MFQKTQRNYKKKNYRDYRDYRSFASIEPLTLKVYLRCGAQTTGPF